MQIKKIAAHLYQPKNLWLFIFAYTLLIGLFVQLFLLPVLLPSLHVGNGLLVGMDGGKFHRIAIRLVEKIQQSGWSEWELLPESQLISGIAAIFYTIIYPAPWSVLPLNAALNAAAGTCLFLILKRITDHPTASLIAITPFLFFPSSLLWNAQFHNENYVVPGVMFLLYGWSSLIDWQKSTTKEKILSIAAVLVGGLFIGLVRKEILSGIAWLFLAISLGTIIFWLVKKAATPQNIVLILAAAVILLSSSTLIKKMSEPTEYPLNISGRTFSNTSELVKLEWERTSWLPDFADKQIKDIARLRSRFIVLWSNGSSNIDTDIEFHNIWQVASYLPRAAQIAFFSPFPNMWFTDGAKETSAIMRAVSAFETIVVYLLLAGLPIFLWRYRRQPVVWMIVFISTSMLLTYALTIPNLGALYRFRFPYLMPLVCFGFLGLLHKFMKTNNKAAKENPS